MEQKVFTTGQDRQAGGTLKKQRRKNIPLNLLPALTGGGDDHAKEEILIQSIVYQFSFNVDATFLCFLIIIFISYIYKQVIHRTQQIGTSVHLSISRHVIMVLDGWRSSLLLQLSIAFTVIIYNGENQTIPALTIVFRFSPDDAI